MWFYTKVAGGRWVWVWRGLHQKQSVGSASRRGFDGHVSESIVCAGLLLQLGERLNQYEDDIPSCETSGKQTDGKLDFGGKETYVKAR